MKLAFIALNSQYIHTCLALSGLATLARPYGDVEYCDFNVNQEYRSLIALIPKADTYFFSCYIWNRTVILSLMNDLKRIYPGCNIYVGGPEAQGTPEDFLKWGDGVFLGEGESALLEFLGGELPRSLHTKEHQGVIVREDVLAFDYPFDYINPKKICYYESQRGCPYHCSYCLSAEVDRLVDVPIDKVKSDLTRLVEQGVRLIKLVDRSFNAKPKRCIELLQFFGEFTQDVTFHVELSPYGLSDDLIEVIRALPEGRLQVELGFQALQADVLQKIDRPAYSEAVLERLARFMELPIHRHIDLIAGLPGMSYFDVTETFDYLFSLHPDDLQVGFLKVLPGTPLYRHRFEFGLVASANPPYEILQTTSISFSQLNELKQVAALAHWFHPGSYPETFRYLQPSSPFELYQELVQAVNPLEDKSLEDRLRLIQVKLRDETLKEYLEIDYHRVRRHRKVLFFPDREVSVREMLASPLLEQIKQLIPDFNELKLQNRISLYRTRLDKSLVLYDYHTNTMEYLEE